MVKVKLKFILSALIPTAFCLLPGVTNAQDGNQPWRDLPASHGILIHRVTSSFRPVSVTMLREKGLGELRQYSATSVEFDHLLQSNIAEDKVQELRVAGRTSGTNHDLLVGAILPLNKLGAPEKTFPYAIFLASRDADFAATEVSFSSAHEIQHAVASKNSLDLNVKALERELKIERAERLDLEERLLPLREQASKLADVEEIVELRLRAKSLETEKNTVLAELERLRILVDFGRDQEDSKSINELRQQLALDLQESAKVTAAADRLSVRREEVAYQDFMQKVHTVREMQDIDPGMLAREVLRLRKERQALERRMGVAEDSPAGRDF